MTTSSPTTPAPEAPLTSVAVLGARGRMGVEVCKAVNEAEDLELVAMVEGSEWLFNVADGGAQVAVDFTRPESVMENIRFCIDQGIHCVVGTSGFDEAKIATVREWLAPKPDLGVLIAPNFGIGAVLLMKFAAEASRFFSSVELVELHHPGKVDAPSGTATRTAQLIGEARRAAGLGPAPDATQAEASLPGPAGHWSTACRCTRSGSRGWSRTRRCCSVPRARR
ncbi:4-hydroxy-tetrahydrodipicolinate reductase [Klenkia terrae]|uniref:4-hydroxy-tetrahydrodipicolinate reductase n=1 Tax=Klenkia terrae TaxID=1052259 RepID=UPI00361E59D8